MIKEDNVKIKKLEEQNEQLNLRYDDLAEKERRVRRRLGSHLFFTKLIIGFILLLSLLCLIVVGGGYAFFKQDPVTLNHMLNDEIQTVPFYGVAIIGWIVMIAIVFIAIIYLIVWFMDGDCDDL